MLTKTFIPYDHLHQHLQFQPGEGTSRGSILVVRRQVTSEKSDWCFTAAAGVDLVRGGDSCWWGEPRPCQLHSHAGLSRSDNILCSLSCCISRLSQTLHLPSVCQATTTPTWTRCTTSPPSSGCSSGTSRQGSSFRSGGYTEAQN